jgi:hypothetical protein
MEVFVEVGPHHRVTVHHDAILLKQEVYVGPKPISITVFSFAHFCPEITTQLLYKKNHIFSSSFK